MGLLFAFDRASVALALVLTACAWGNYRVVSRTPEGGEVALLGSGEEEARKKAEGYMTSVCPHCHEVIEESEAVASDDRANGKPATTDLIGHTKQSSAAVANEDRRESRLKYRCKPQALIAEKRALRLVLSWCGTMGSTFRSAVSSSRRNFSTAQILRPAHFGQTRMSFLRVKRVRTATHFASE